MGAAGAFASFAALAAFTAYAVASHWIMVNAAREPWAVAVIFGPLVLAVAAGGWQRRQPWVLLGCAAGVAVLAAVVARGGVADVNRLYLLQYLGVQLALAGLFATSLRPGGVPLVTLMARAVHARLKQPFTPAMQRYTRGLTAFWAGCFVALALLSLLIYALAPWSWWSLFANLLTPLAVGAVMVAEHLLRYRRHPEFERISLHAVMNAWRGLDTSGTRP